MILVRVKEKLSWGLHYELPGTLLYCTNPTNWENNYAYDLSGRYVGPLVSLNRIEIIEQPKFIKFVLGLKK